MNEDSKTDAPVMVDITKLVTITQFIKLQKEAGRKPSTKPGLFYAMAKGKIAFVRIAGKPFIYKDQPKPTPKAETTGKAA